MLKHWKPLQREESIQLVWLLPLDTALCALNNKRVNQLAIAEVQ